MSTSNCLDKEFRTVASVQLLGVIAFRWRLEPEEIILGENVEVKRFRFTGKLESQPRDKEEFRTVVSVQLFGKVRSGGVEKMLK